MQAGGIVQQPITAGRVAAVCSAVQRRPVAVVADVHLGAKLTQHLHDLDQALQAAAGPKSAARALCRPEVLLSGQPMSKCLQNAVRPCRQQLKELAE